MQTTWDKVIELAGTGFFCDLQITAADGSIKRGPIVTIRRGENNLIVIETVWMARKVNIHDHWENIGTTAVSVSDECRPYFNQSKIVCFGNRFIGEFKVYHKYAEPIDPGEVSDLEPDDVRRTRALMYDLPLDANWDTIVERVVDDLGANGLTTPEEQLQVQEERDQFAEADA